MSYFHVERLPALDASFLEIEDGCSHMHVGAVAVFDAGPLRRADGALDVDRIRRRLEVSLHRMPRYRQRLTRLPLTGDWAWVDDDRFDLHYHFRHSCLPPPGSERMLKRLAGRVMSQQLDRGKPLWELWIVDGLEGDRFGLITKAHHCMIDGVGSVELMAALLQSAPDSSPPPDPPTWIPRPQPDARQMLGAELGRRAALGGTAVRSALDAVSRPLETLGRARETLGGLAEALGAGLRPASASPLNVPIGPHRRFDWTRHELSAVQEVRSALGGTLNDVVLAVVSGALRRFLSRRGEEPGGLDFRVLIPVNRRIEGQSGAGGNFVSMLTARLPLAAPGPAERLARVSETTRALKSSRQSRGVEILEGMGDWAATSLFVHFVRLAGSARTYNMTVTNVPGPATPFYLLGAEMREAFPLVPLYREQALGIALLSYHGALTWGFNADWDAVPDLHDFAESVDLEFERLRKAAADHR